MSGSITELYFLLDGITESGNVLSENFTNIEGKLWSGFMSILASELIQYNVKLIKTSLIIKQSLLLSADSVNIQATTSKQFIVQNILHSEGLNHFLACYVNESL